MFFDFFDFSCRCGQVLIRVYERMDRLSRQTNLSCFKRYEKVAGC